MDNCDESPEHRSKSESNFSSGVTSLTAESIPLYKWKRLRIPSLLSLNRKLDSNMCAESTDKQGISSSSRNKKKRLIDIPHNMCLLSESKDSRKEVGDRNPNDKMARVCNRGKVPCLIKVNHKVNKIYDQRHQEMFLGVKKAEFSRLLGKYLKSDGRTATNKGRPERTVNRKQYIPDRPTSPSKSSGSKEHRTDKSIVSNYDRKAELSKTFDNKHFEKLRIKRRQTNSEENQIHHRDILSNLYNNFKSKTFQCKRSYNDVRNLYSVCIQQQRLSDDKSISRNGDKREARDERIFNDCDNCSVSKTENWSRCRDVPKENECLQKENKREDNDQRRKNKENRDPRIVFSKSENGEQHTYSQQGMAIQNAVQVNNSRRKKLVREICGKMKAQSTSEQRYYSSEGINNKNSGITEFSKNEKLQHIRSPVRSLDRTNRSRSREERECASRSKCDIISRKGQKIYSRSHNGYGRACSQDRSNERLSKHRITYTNREKGERDICWNRSKENKESFSCLKSDGCCEHAMSPDTNKNRYMSSTDRSSTYCQTRTDAFLSGNKESGDQDRNEGRKHKKLMKTQEENTRPLSKKTSDSFNDSDTCTHSESSWSPQPYSPNSYSHYRSTSDARGSERLRRENKTHRCRRTEKDYNRERKERWIRDRIKHILETCEESDHSPSTSSCGSYTRYKRPFRKYESSHENENLVASGLPLMRGPIKQEPHVSVSTEGNGNCISETIEATIQHPATKQPNRDFLEDEGKNKMLSAKSEMIETSFALHQTPYKNIANVCSSVESFTDALCHMKNFRDTCIKKSQEPVEEKNLVSNIKSEKSQGYNYTGKMNCISQIKNQQQHTVQLHNVPDSENTRVSAGSKQDLSCDNSVSLRGAELCSDIGKFASQPVMHTTYIPEVLNRDSGASLGFEQELLSSKCQYQNIGNGFINHPHLDYARLPDVGQQIKPSISPQVCSHNTHKPNCSLVSRAGFPAGDPLLAVQTSTESASFYNIPFDRQCMDNSSGTIASSLEPQIMPSGPRPIHITSQTSDSNHFGLLHHVTNSQNNIVTVSVPPPNSVFIGINPILNNPVNKDIPPSTESHNPAVDFFKSVGKLPYCKTAPLTCNMSPSESSEILKGSGFENSTDYDLEMTTLDKDQLAIISQLEQLSNLLNIQASLKLEECRKDESTVMSQIKTVSRLLTIQTQLNEICRQKQDTQMENGQTQNLKEKGKDFCVPSQTNQTNTGKNYETSVLNGVTDMDIASPIHDVGCIELPSSLNSQNDMISVETNNIVDMDIASPIHDVGYIELPSSSKLQNDMISAENNDIIDMDIGSPIHDKGSIELHSGLKSQNDITIIDSVGNKIIDIYTGCHGKGDIEVPMFSHSEHLTDSSENLIHNTSQDLINNKSEIQEESIASKMFNDVFVVKSVPQHRFKEMDKTDYKSFLWKNVSVIKDEDNFRKGASANFKVEFSSHKTERKRTHHSSKHHYINETSKDKDLQMKTVRKFHCQTDNQMPSPGSRMPAKDKVRYFWLF